MCAHTRTSIRCMLSSFHKHHHNHHIHNYHCHYCHLFNHYPHHCYLHYHCYYLPMCCRCIRAFSNVHIVFYQIHFLLDYKLEFSACLCHYDFIFLKFITGCISFQKLDRKTADICVSWRPHRHIHIHPQTEIHVYVYINTLLSVYWDQTAYDFERMQPLKYNMENVLTCFMKVITKGVLY